MWLPWNHDTVLLTLCNSVTCRGFGRASDDYNKTQLRFNNRVYLDSLSRGEYLLRCGIDTSTYIVFIIIIYYSTHSLSRTTAHLRNRTTTQGFGSPRIAWWNWAPSCWGVWWNWAPSHWGAWVSQASGNPLHDSTSLPCSISTSRLLSYPERAGIPIYEEGTNTPSGLVQRPQYLPLRLQPRSPERSTHTSLSIRW